MRGFRLFSTVIQDVTPPCGESVVLKWTDLTQTDQLVNVRYKFPRHRVCSKAKQVNNNKVEEWLVKNLQYPIPPARIF